MTIDQVLRDFLLPPSFSLFRLLSRCTYRRGSKSMLTDRTIGIYAICKDIFVIYSCPFLCCVSWSRCIDLLEVWKSSRVAPQFTASCCWWSNFMRSFPIHLVNYTSQSTVTSLTSQHFSQRVYIIDTVKNSGLNRINLFPPWKLYNLCNVKDGFFCFHIKYRKLVLTVLCIHAEKLPTTSQRTIENQIDAGHS